MAKFWELFAESVIIQAVMALGLLGAIIYLVVTGQEVPDILVEGFLLVLGFYFGSKSTAQAQKIVKEVKKP